MTTTSYKKYNPTQDIIRQDPLEQYKIYHLVSDTGSKGVKQPFYNAAYKSIKPQDLTIVKFLRILWAYLVFLVWVNVLIILYQNYQEVKGFLEGTSHSVFELILIFAVICIFINFLFDCYIESIIFRNINSIQEIERDCWVIMFTLIISLIIAGSWWSIKNPYSIRDKFLHLFFSITYYSALAEEETVLKNILTRAFSLLVLLKRFLLTLVNAEKTDIIIALVFGTLVSVIHSMGLYMLWMIKYELYGLYDKTCLTQLEIAARATPMVLILYIVVWPSLTFACIGAISVIYVIRFLKAYTHL